MNVFGKKYLDKYVFYVFYADENSQVPDHRLVHIPASLVLVNVFPPKYIRVSMRVLQL